MSAKMKIRFIGQSNWLPISRREATRGSQTVGEEETTPTVEENPRTRERKKRRRREGPFRCDLCLEVFPEERLLEEHEVRRRVYLSCRVCGASFCRQAELRNHARLHQSGGERVFGCRDCGKRYVHYFHLRNHLRAHVALKGGGRGVERGHLCMECGRTFLSEESLRSHEEATHREEAEDLECSVCQETFPTRTHLQAHAVAHTGSRRYACETCGKRFLHGVILKKHMETHRESTYVCHACGKTFSSPGSLQRHADEHDQLKRRWCDVHPKVKDFTNKEIEGQLNGDEASMETPRKLVVCTQLGANKGREMGCQTHDTSPLSDEGYSPKEAHELVKSEVQEEFMKDDDLVKDYSFKERQDIDFGNTEFIKEESMYSEVTIKDEDICETIGENDGFLEGR